MGQTTLQSGSSTGCQALCGLNVISKIAGTRSGRTMKVSIQMPCDNATANCFMIRSDPAQRPIIQPSSQLLDSTDSASPERTHVPPRDI